MGTRETALTAHLVMPEGQADDAFLQHATDRLHDGFEIRHVTLQVMRVPFTAPCATLGPPAMRPRSTPESHVDGPTHGRGGAVP